jgi:hypothetical protein
VNNVKPILLACLWASIVFQAGSAFADPIGVDPTPTPAPSACLICATCKKNIEPSDVKDPTDTTANSGKTAACQAACVDCYDKSILEIPGSDTNIGNSNKAQ